jgi:hypothetical protein
VKYPVLQTENPAHSSTSANGKCANYHYSSLPKAAAARRCHSSFLTAVWYQTIGPATGSTSGSTGTNATNFRINGGQGLGADILIDGAQTRRGENGTFFSEVAPGPNAFQEFTLSTSSYSAEFGNSSGGVVNFTIKTGSNDFHGEAYLFTSTMRSTQT